MAGGGPASTAADVRAGDDVRLRRAAAHRLHHQRGDVLLHRRRDRRGVGGRLPGGADARGSSPRPAGTGSAPGSRCATTCPPGSTRSALRSGPGERIELGYGPHAAYTLPARGAGVGGRARPGARRAAAHPRRRDARTRTGAQRAAHGSVPALLDDVGVLGGRVLAAHGVQLSDADIALLADRGAAVAHCPGSNAKLAAGIARVTALRRAGVRVGLGTDGPASGRRPRPVGRGPAGRPARPGDQRGRRRAHRGRAAADGHPGRRGRDRPRRHRRPRSRPLGRPGARGPRRPGLRRPRRTTPSCCPTWCGPAGRALVRDVWVAGEQVLADRRADPGGPARPPPSPCARWRPGSTAESRYSPTHAVTSGEPPGAGGGGRSPGLRRACASGRTQGPRRGSGP